MSVKILDTGASSHIPGVEAGRYSTVSAASRFEPTRGCGLRRLVRVLLHALALGLGDAVHQRRDIVTLVSTCCLGRCRTEYRLSSSLSRGSLSDRYSVPSRMIASVSRAAATGREGSVQTPTQPKSCVDTWSLPHVLADGKSHGLRAMIDCNFVVWHGNPDDRLPTRPGREHACGAGVRNAGSGGGGGRLNSPASVAHTLIFETAGDGVGDDRVFAQRRP
jgi:hypothetical protein